MNSLENKVAIVTGGTKGIGRAIARKLLDLGSKVVICSRNERDVNQCAQELSQTAGDRIAGKPCDVRDVQQVRELVKLALSRFGGIDILINNAAVGLYADISEMTPEQWKEVIDTNLTGVFYCCHAAIPHLKKRGGGYIINISSLAGKNPFKGGSAYNASKFGLNGFSEAIMQDLRYDNIRVSYVMPGSVDTSFGRSAGTGDDSWKLSPNDVAQVVADLLRHDPRCLPSAVEMRPSKPPKK
jgi:3-oxoacyl-[acyl-carrier protein] reductase